VDWAVDESLDRLISEGAIEPMIAVALTSTDNRTAEYSPGLAGEAYLRFLVEQVRPMIDAEYRTLPGPEHTIVGGSSMGGLVSCMFAWRYPEVFGAALCFSPAFRIEGRADWLPFFTKGGPAPPDSRRPFLYLDNGGIGLEERLQPGIDDMLAYLEGEGWARGEDFVFVLDPEARHFESAWAKRFPEALLSALGALGRRARE
jgi:predicted alpha/beta superfamily hydrolase